MPSPHHTFLFADLAGFTALTEAHGDEDAPDLVMAADPEVSAGSLTFAVLVLALLGLAEAVAIVELLA